jgi:hypothetical protein
VVVSEADLAMLPAMSVLCVGLCGSSGIAAAAGSCSTQLAAVVGLGWVAVTWDGNLQDSCHLCAYAQLLISASNNCSVASLAVYHCVLALVCGDCGKGFA